MEINKPNIEAHLNGTIEELRRSYESKGIKASGRWGESLESYIEESEGSVKVGIKAFDYIQYPEYGRGANQAPSVQAAKNLYPIILEWASVKGISVTNLKAFAFRTALKIVYRGIKVPNKHNVGGVVGDVLTEDWARGVVEVVGSGYLESFNSEILRNIKRSWQ